MFRDKRNKIIYIGKAVDLRNRLSSYLSPAKERIREQTLMSAAADLDIIITNSDIEALTLEESLIKLNKPRYNVRLKDDKKFPYLKITIQERFPRIIFTRDLKADGSLIFGPYTNARALRRTRDALCRIFKLVSCTKDLEKPHKRPCLQYHLGRCSAPCTGRITEKEYAGLVNKAIKFLRGNSNELEKGIERMMWQHAENENFEAAAALRDQLLAVRTIFQHQRMVTNTKSNRDVIAFSRSRFNCAACLFRIREGRLIAKEIFFLKINPHVGDEEIAASFIRLIYTHISFIPEELVISTMPADWRIQSRWFKEKGTNVKISTGRRGEIKRLLKWAEKNAELELSKKIFKKRIPPAIIELQNILALEKAPRWIETFDVSNLKEKFAVGSSVVFRDGKPDKQHYRHYRIKRVKGQNDFAMIREIVMRRIKDLMNEKKQPDLLLIDGGKGQLNAALEALKLIKLKIPVFALAKKYNELYNSSGKVVAIPPGSSGLTLLKRARDEAHRFAINYHRKVRDRALTSSLLDGIAGIGEKRKLALLKYFGSIDALKKASEEDITRVPGIGKKYARIIYEALHI